MAKKNILLFDTIVLFRIIYLYIFSTFVCIHLTIFHV